MKKIWKVLAALVLALIVGIIASQRVTAQETETETQTEAEVEVDVEEGVDVEEVLQEARTLFRHGDTKGGLAVLEKAIAKDPKAYDLMVVAANEYNQYGIDMASDDRKAANEPLRRAAVLMRKVQAGKEELNDREQRMLSVFVYNEACCAAIDENADDAFKLLREAIELGFDDMLQLKSDSDFESIREDERFESILAELEEMTESKRKNGRPTDDA